MLARMFDDIIFKPYILLGILACYSDFQHVFCCYIDSDDIVKNGNTCYYFSSDEKTRSEASSFCASSDGTLVVDKDENIHKKLKDRTIQNSMKEYWIGLSLGTTHYWTLTGGTNAKEISGNDTEGPCIISNADRWEYSDCTDNRRYVCKTGVYTNGTCPLSFHKEKNHCYFLSSENTLDNYGDASGVCYFRQSHLVTITDHEEQEFLTGNILEPFWLGLSAYIWDNNDRLHWETWNTKGNVGVDACVFLQKSHWHSAPCENKKHFICETQCDRSCFTTTMKPASTTIKPASPDFITSRPSTSTSTSTTKYTSPSSLPTTSQTTATLSSGTTISSDPTKSQTSLHDTFTTNILDYEPESPVTTKSISVERTSMSSDPPTERTDKIISPEKEVNTVLIGSVVGAAGVVILVVLLVVIIYRRKRQRKNKSNRKGDYDASYEIAFSPNTEDKTRNSDNSLTDDEKLAQLRNRDSRVVIDSNVPDSEKIKPYLVTTIVDGHGEGQPSRRSKVVSSIEDRVEYDNNNLDELIVTDNDLYHSSRSDSYRSNARHEHTDYDYAAHPPNRSQLSQGNVFINNAYDGEAEGGAVNDVQGAQIHYADIAFSTETLNKENTYADIDDFSPSIVASDAKVPTTAGMDPRENTPGISNNDADSGNQAGEMKAIPVYAEVDANKMDKNKNEIIDERKDTHDAEEGVNDMIVTDNDLYDFNN